MLLSLTFSACGHGQLDEKAPVFASDTPSSVEVDENQKDVLSISASDESGRVFYSLAGVDKDFFTIDTKGKITFKTAPDYESGKITYTIEVIAKDIVGNTSKKTITVKVKDVDDTAPVFASNTPSSIEVDENQKDVLSISASDESGKVFYSLGGVDKDFFNIDTKGKITFKTAPDFESGKTSYTIVVILKDEVGNISKKTITVKVKDILETSPKPEPSPETKPEESEPDSVGDTKKPVFSSSTPSSIEVDENKKDVLSISASDEGGKVLYSLSGLDKNFFIIDAKGKITFKNMPDFESGKTTYTIVVILKDEAGNTSEKPITIKVKDVDDTKPVFKQSTPSSIEVDENKKDVLSISASDESGKVFYSLGGLDKNFFIIDTKGKITFKNMPDFESGKTTYTIVVILKDEAGNTSKKPITIKVKDVDDTKPVFSSSTPSSVEINENKKDVLNISASDESGKVFYSLGGLDKDFFIIDTKGKITFKTAPDYESGKTTYTIVVILKDKAGNTSKKTITVKVKDVDEVLPDTKKPVFASDTPSSIEVDENQKDVLSISASDESGKVLYSLGGLDKDFFIIDTKGKITFKTAADYESGKTTYTIEVIAKDETGNTSKKTITIKVKDIDENPTTLSTSSPEFLASLATGQTTSYTNYDDGYYQKGKVRNFTRGAGIVTDHITGLQWQDDYSDNGGEIVAKPWVTEANYNAGKYDDTSGDTASTYCANLSLGGYDDWRLPSVSELLSIVDNSKYSPAISSVFEKTTTASHYYWSSTTYARFTYHAWYVYFYDGRTNNGSKGGSNGVRCVRAGQ